MKTFLITGVSTGLGRAFAAAALEAGHTVVGTVRKNAYATAFTALDPHHAHARVLDVTDERAVFAVVPDVEKTVGAVDVLIANAGYGLEGTFEETPLAALRAQFDVNVFGAAAMVQAMLPYLRERRRGHVLAVTSMGGLAGFAGVSAYCGSSTRSKASWRPSARRSRRSASTSPPWNPARSAPTGPAAR